MAEVLDFIIIGITQLTSVKRPRTLLQASSICYFSQINKEEKRRQQFRYVLWLNEMMVLLSDLINLLWTTINYRMRQVRKET